MGREQSCLGHISGRCGARSGTGQQLGRSDCQRSNSTRRKWRCYRAKEVREVTEGRVPAVLNLEGKIDYNAGQNAKARLPMKLGAAEVE